MTTPELMRPSGLDHLVVLAQDLPSGEAWCESYLGVLPGPGGEHPLMGTHNRLLRIDSPNFPLAYLEIIAINPDASPVRKAPLKRWFDMDDTGLMQDIQHHGPQLVHWVARVNDLAASLQAWSTLGLARGEALQAQRSTPQGLLKWQISVRDDGQRLMQGCLPTLIAWGQIHPTAQMPKSALMLTSLTIAHPEAELLSQALKVVGIQGVTVQPGQASITATLETPKGQVTLSSR